MGDVTIMKNVNIQNNAPEKMSKKKPTKAEHPQQNIYVSQIIFAKKYNFGSFSKIVIEIENTKKKINSQGQT